MSWQVRYSERALKQLSKLDKHVAALIVGWMEKNIDGCADPRAHGKGLTANLSGKWRYRVGDYRVLCDIQDGQLVVLALEVQHRSSVYSNRRDARRRR